MIQVEQLTKSFNKNKAVNNVSFTIDQGEIFGLLGPNGAGKSTTINMMSTLLKCDSGSIKINGLDINANTYQCKQLIGVVPQEISLYEQFTAQENLLFWGSLYGLPKKDLLVKIDELLELIGLKDRKDDLIKNFSGGMKRRINIASALLHTPTVLFMDEPTVGVDPQSRNRIFEVVETLNKNGMTIIYTSHYMEEIERLCNRIAIIDEGRIVAQGAQAELQKSCTANEQIVITTANLNSKIISTLKSNDLKFTHNDNKLIFNCDINNDLSKIISVCNAENVEIQDLELKKINLETVFLELTGKQLRD